MNGTIFDGNYKQIVLGNRLVNISVIKVMNIKEMAVHVLENEKSEIITEPEGKSFNKLYRHKLY